MDRLWISAPRAYAGREVQPSPFIGEALGPEAEAWLKEAAAGAAQAAAAAAEPKFDPQRPLAAVVNAVPKPPRAKAKAAVPELPGRPAREELMNPGTPVFHERHGEGVVESLDGERGRVIVDFSGKRLSMDLAWCVGSPQFFRILGG
ncbi:MAG TPA: hypothetical protein VK464_27860, partial [Symbiobacteriaceae bacterium]|nr:hypothetical protein [Symbiobacteriaceae bacterium]